VDATDAQMKMQAELAHISAQRAQCVLRDEKHMQLASNIN
jgi:hypothetical protein